MHNQHQGSCLCGAVTYRVSGELKAVTHCHCRKCQKSHGAAFASYASAPRATVSISDDSAALKDYESSPGVLRQFCCQCGSSLFWWDAQGEFSTWMSIAIATLDTPFAAPRQKHHCVAMKASWHEISDHYPQLE
ncbi:GFA family protein [Pseudomonas sp. Fl5BN2]|uniref:GFA family protein n=1 Tax=unclassified Pseudomonas TaxID=196821 RepID=UPI001377672F|nr:MULTISPECIES: GFA family protein [unclassified Pseudomonas]NBF05925.1 GFA family protein [Pseudomonas sp. Fl5BN2]NBF10813.1 GFA family protein [Pseudomonas sp. Fl4BN1]